MTEAVAAPPDVTNDPNSIAPVPPGNKRVALHELTPDVLEKTNGATIYKSVSDKATLPYGDGPFWTNIPGTTEAIQYKVSKRPADKPLVLEPFTPEAPEVHKDLTAKTAIGGLGLALERRSIKLLNGMANWADRRVHARRVVAHKFFMGDYEAKGFFERRAAKRYDKLTIGLAKAALDHVFAPGGAEESRQHKHEHKQEKVNKFRAAQDWRGRLLGFVSKIGHSGTRKLSAHIEKTAQPPTAKGERRPGVTMLRAGVELESPQQLEEEIARRLQLINESTKIIRENRDNKELVRKERGNIGRFTRSMRKLREDLNENLYIEYAVLTRTKFGESVRMYTRLNNIEGNWLIHPDGSATLYDEKGEKPCGEFKPNGLWDRDSSESTA